jgi:molybdopterin-guanine dinucleotide biosynthesis protein B
VNSIVSIVGKSGVGKTSLVERLIVELNRRGYQIATIKHSRGSPEVDQPGKDSYRLARAGSGAVIISSPNKLALIKAVNHDPAIEELLRLIGSDFDLILTEGFRSENTPQIEVHRGELGDLLCAPEELSAIATDEPVDTDVPQLPLNDTVAIADFIEKNFMLRDEENTFLFVNGNPVLINPFVKDIISKVVLALTSTLKGIEEIRNLDIWIRRKP